MELFEKLQKLRKEKNLSQEGLAEKLGVSRQAVAKWELNQSIPDIENLICISQFFHVTIDRLVKPEEACIAEIIPVHVWDKNLMVKFLCQAKVVTYAGKGKENDKPSRPKSHDLHYSQGEWLYIDTYVGSEKFIGEEVVWYKDVPIWAMNYSGRVISENFSSGFFKEALKQVTYEKPFRGPEFYRKGDYTYHCIVTGDINWFQGYETMYCLQEKVCETYFHGGEVK